MATAASPAVMRPAHDARRQVRPNFSTIILALILAGAGWIGAPRLAHADGSLEWSKDGTFGRAGFTAHLETTAARATVDDDGDTATRAGRKGRPASASKPITADPAVSSSASEPSRKRASKGVRVASIGRSEDYTPPKRSITGSRNVNWIASSSCLASNLRSAINHVAQNYGSVTVNSTCRSRGHNRRVGGASKSYHLTGNAADLRVHGNVRAAVAYLRGAAGGFKHYGGGLFHIDNGPTRSF